MSFEDPTVHVAGTVLTLQDRYIRQLCAWCGHRLVDVDLERVEVLEADVGRPFSTWPVGSLVEVYGSMSVVLAEADEARSGVLPERSCTRR